MIYQVVYTRWLGESVEWASTSSAKRLFCIIGRIPMLPFLAILYAFVPSFSFSRAMASPVNRFNNHVASYLIFLMLIYYQSNLDKSKAPYGPTVSGNL
jgi:hypothetical protein